MSLKQPVALPCNHISLMVSRNLFMYQLFLTHKDHCVSSLLLLFLDLSLVSLFGYGSHSLFVLSTSLSDFNYIFLFGQQTHAFSISLNSGMRLNVVFSLGHGNHEFTSLFTSFVCLNVIILFVAEKLRALCFLKSFNNFNFVLLSFQRSDHSHISCTSFLHLCDCSHFAILGLIFPISALYRF